MSKWIKQEVKLTHSKKESAHPLRKRCWMALLLTFPPDRMLADEWLTEESPENPADYRHVICCLLFCVCCLLLRLCFRCLCVYCLCVCCLLFVFCYALRGYVRLRKATEGYVRLRKATEGYVRLRKAMKGCERLRKATKGLKSSHSYRTCLLSLCHRYVQAELI